MVRKFVGGMLFVLAILESGCARDVVHDPSKITLQDAMVSVVDGLQAMHQAEGNSRYGLVPDEVTVVFNVTATGSQSGELHLDVTSPAALGAGGKAGGSLQMSEQATRGNVVTIKFKNLLLAPDNSVVAKKTSAQITQTLKELHKAGITTYSVKIPSLSGGAKNLSMPELEEALRNLPKPERDAVVKSALKKP